MTDVYITEYNHDKNDEVTRHDALYNWCYYGIGSLAKPEQTKNYTPVHENALNQIDIFALDNLYFYMGTFHLIIFELQNSNIKNMYDLLERGQKNKNT